MNDEIKDYIANQDQSIQPILKKAYRTIHKALPKVEERISWGMPTFWNTVNIIHFAPAKQHLGIYPGPQAILHFQNEIETRGLKYSKGAIQFPYDRVDYEFLYQIAEWCGKQNKKSL